METLISIGHRNHRLSKYPDINSKIIDFYTSIIETQQPQIIVSTLTPGADFLLAETAFVLRIPYAVYLPYENTSRNFTHDLKRRYNQLLKNAYKVSYTSKGPFTPDKVKFNINYIIDKSTKCAFVWDGSPGVVKNYVFRLIKTDKFLSVFDPNTNEIISR